MNDTKKISLINELVANFGTTVSRQQLVAVASKFNVNHAFLTTNKIGRGVYDISAFVSGGSDVKTQTVTVELSDEEILDGQRRRFRTLDRMASGVVSGKFRSMIVSGPAGIGKTYTIEGMLENAEIEGKIQYKKITGFVKATGLFKALWDNRHENSVILIDDADSAFDDEIALNILKAALDSSKRRVISWASEKVFIDEMGDAIPNEFEYRGSMIFITNKNFETAIAQGKSLAPHFQALISRSFYIDLNMNSTREYLLRMEDVLKNTDMAYTLGLTESDSNYLMKFIRSNANRMRELSLRAMLKAAKILAASDSRSEFEETFEDTCLRRK
jgi:hypothetical protein